MSEEQTMQVDSASHQRNAARAKRDEEELEQLKREHLGEQGDSDQEQEDDGTSPEPEKVSKEVEEPKLSKEEESFKKRYGDLRRHMQDKEQETKVELEKLKSQLSQAARNELVLPKSDKDIEAWVKKYPDVAGIVEAIAEKKASERSSELDGRLKQIEGLRVQATRDKAEAELMSLHSDFMDIRSDDAFHTWAEEQPKWVQDALYENMDDAKSVARVIDLYKVDNNITSKKSNSSDKSAASSIKARTRNTPETDATNSYFKESQVNKMTAKQYEKNSDAIMEAIRSGKFVYDVSQRK